MLCKPSGGLGVGEQELQESGFPQRATACSARSLLGMQKGRALWALWLHRDLIPKKGLSQLLLHLDYATGRRAAKVALPTEAWGPGWGFVNHTPNEQPAVICLQWLLPTVSTVLWDRKGSGDNS